jgi:hypothetical protein
VRGSNDPQRVSGATGFPQPGADADAPGIRGVRVAVAVCAPEPGRTSLLLLVENGSRSGILDAVG